jgi:hypothetical protein
MGTEDESAQTRAARIAQRFWQREADPTHALLVKRADALVGCTEGSPKEEELERLTDVIGAYEAKRWPQGKVAGGKG